ncbi:endo alpha-1,4 polygalactosaminidase [Pseudothermotoga thermarum]|uniref:TM1410 hypothetical-related protein n=1 Tax=Pseudothermotoga thermarum DSM 5069 TaxID=688269 RepID=F7YUX8_9THEM|nr:endo alpha-1,4 polygalactosaminidase [Pseudothermotoga thermarum]AEH51540.1 TM1410 hypothetical-related protein [Pseudothermotoga thermarum DSM 5069]
MRIAIVMFLLMSCSLAALQFPRSVAFLYHGKPSESAYRYFDWIVVDPNDLETEDFVRRKNLVFAYLNVGEAEKLSPSLNRQWVIGRNDLWNSYIMDIRVREYREYLFRKIEREIVPKKFAGIFLDTLDSYQLVLKGKDAEEYEIALADFIIQLSNRYPHLRILVNRAFHILDNIEHLISGFVFEGLYSTWEKTKDNKVNYFSVPENLTQFYIPKLKSIKKKGIPVIVIDYTDIRNKKQVKELIEKISNHGFIPYISVRNLDTLGYGPLNIPSN